MWLIIPRRAKSNLTTEAFLSVRFNCDTIYISRCNPVRHRDQTSSILYIGFRTLIINCIFNALVMMILLWFDNVMKQYVVALLIVDEQLRRLFGGSITTLRYMASECDVETVL